MNETMVSIIMPVYGVEDYVGGAIESLQAQTLTNWELIAVDDGSKDNSGKICDEYAQKDARIKVIHKENGGAPSARNVAIDKAVGKYMYFCDADDWAEPTMLADMVEIAELNDRELVIAGFYIDTYYNDTEKFTQEQFFGEGVKVYENQQSFRLDAHKMFDKNLLYTPWNKLISSKYIRDNRIYFPQTFWDDFPFNLNIIRDVERVAVTSKKYYHFIRKRAESETARYRDDMFEKREEEHGWMVDLYNYWNIKSDEVTEFISRRYIERIVGCIENVTNKNCKLSSKEKKAQIKAMISSNTAQLAVRRAKPTSLYMKLMLLPIRMNNTTLTYLEGRIISSVKSSNTKMFAKLKARR